MRNLSARSFHFHSVCCTYLDIKNLYFKFASNLNLIWPPLQVIIIPHQKMNFVGDNDLGSVGQSVVRLCFSPPFRLSEICHFCLLKLTKYLKMSVRINISNTNKHFFPKLYTSNCVYVFHFHLKGVGFSTFSNISLIYIFEKFLMVVPDSCFNLKLPPYAPVFYVQNIKMCIHSE